MATKKNQASQVMEHPCSELATQNAQLLARAKYITPTIADLVEIYQQCEILGDMLYRHQLSFFDSISVTDKEEKANEVYSNRFGADIASLQAKIEEDIMNAILDNISIFGKIEEEKYEKLCKKAA